MAQCRDDAGELADVVEVIDDRLDLDARFQRRRFAADPAGDHHPGVERGADHGVAADQFLELLVAELPLVGHEGPAVVVAGPDRPVVEVQRLPERLVGEVGDVEDDSQPLHFAHQVAPGRRQAAAGAGAWAVAARAVVGRADRPQAAGVGPLQIATA